MQERRISRSSQSRAEEPPPAPTLATGATLREGKLAWHNWSGAQHGQPSARWAPADEDALRGVVRAAGELRVVGAGHSFSPLTSTNGTMISLDRMSGLIRHDDENCRATLWAGTRLYDAGPLLHGIGQAMPNLGDIDRQSLAGVLSTATHGTGITLPCIAARATGLRLVTAQGDVLQVSAERDGDVFRAAAISLGALGVITQVTLQNVPAYRLHEQVRVLPLDKVLPEIDRWKRDHRNFELWAFPYSRQAIVKTLETTAAEPTSEPKGGDSADRLLKLCSEAARALPGMTSRLQGLIARFVKPTERVNWSYRIFPSSRNVRFNEMEYHLPEAAGATALDEVCSAVTKTGLNVFFPIEFRFVAGDDYWLSPFQGAARASIAVHQYYKQDYKPVFALAEPILRRHGGRPHWGKLHTADNEALRQLYPDFERFLRLRAELDPQGKLLNPYLRQIFGLTSP